jgi:heterodisulfide reductase subunit A
LASVLKAQRDEHGFFNEAHPKLRPVETLTAGYFLAGAGQGPKDIPEAVAQASGAASKVIGLFSNKTLSHDPPIAAVDEDLCSGCGVCVDVCPYGARELIEKDVKGQPKKVIKVNEVLCECCGACSSACPVGACPQRNLGDEQIESMVQAGLEA